MWLFVLLGSLFTADVCALDSDAWPDREAAHARLRGWGLLAVPALLDGSRAGSAEVRHRCGELLAPWRRRAWELAAARVLTAPDMPDPLAYWLDEQLRTHVTRLALKAGCVYYDLDLFGGCGIMPAVGDQSPLEAWLMLEMFRVQLPSER
jgi:hypothetical protein